ncbi:large subunit GTPase 1 homolog [Cimex lectularius]|uniref:Large subunit GTPase 1 homolog n=1 Tax=Cimex lectularius TaxID=79782 RepID=A0A8I6RH00_CIMLE|nr:large subunit GTPase 1 homolog [Cimex lectularius]
MGKKKKTGLGRALVKDRFSNRGQRKNDSMLHTAELNDGYDWGRLNLRSVTEESSFQEFLSTAELAGTEFQAEKLNVAFVNPSVGIGVLTKEEMAQFQKDKEEKKHLLKIPRRPEWNETMTADEVQAKEKESFLLWRRGLASLQEDSGIILTPYEKNLEFWRQLWRVVERSDVVVQILDSRNPLAFRSEDLESYVHEVDRQKRNLLLVNKSDFLTPGQRKLWYEYFTSAGIRAVFFSATEAAEKLKEIEEEDEEDNLITNRQEDVKQEKQNDSADKTACDYSDADNSDIYNSMVENDHPLSEQLKDLTVMENGRKPWDLLGREELIDLFENILPKDFETRIPGVTTVGLVGYPNVGKSSTINALIAGKKVSVSATPGKTKHFQTLYLTKSVMLCDCPGLVFPSQVSTKAEMVLNGILPVDQMRDHVPPVCLLSSLVPRHVLENKYSVMIPKPLPGEDPGRPPTPEEFLNAYAYSRGFMTQNGQPDNPRAARYVLKDFVQGRLLYCAAPPGVEQDEYHKFRLSDKKVPFPTPQATRAIRVNNVNGNDVDSSFFRKDTPGVHNKGVVKIMPDGVQTFGVQTTTGAKPWKDHSAKRNKREKLRRVYRHLDE